MARYAVPASVREHSIFGMARSFGTPGMFAERGAHGAPPSSDTHRLPASVPTHSTPAFTGDSSTARIVWPLLVALPIFGPRVRSSLIFSHESPRLVVR